MTRQLLYSRRIVTTSGVVEGVLVIEEGKVKAIGPADSYAGEELIDYGDLVIMPGVVDTHVHVNEPGRTEWEGFETATRAAVKGGVTTIVDMPLNCIPVTTTADNLGTKLEQMTDKLYCNVGFHGGIVPDSISDIQNLAEEGVFAFKIFTIHSGIDEFGHITEDHVKEVMRRVKSVGRTLMVHAELESEVDLSGDTRSYSTYLASRPRSWENRAISMLIESVRETGCRTHVIHLSSSGALDMIREAKAEGLPITVETCPHYLHFTAEQVGKGRTEYKCAPPIREASNREALWQAVEGGLIDFISSDHSPSPPGLKLQESGDFMQAWGGIASLQFSLSTVITEAFNRGLPLEKVVELMCTGPANFLGLPTKGRIAPGSDADLVVIDIGAEFTVTEERIEHRHKLTPYLGETLRGRVEATYVGGSPVYDRSTSEFRTAQDPLLFRKEL